MVFSGIFFNTVHVFKNISTLSIWLSQSLTSASIMCHGDTLLIFVGMKRKKIKLKNNKFP